MSDEKENDPGILEWLSVRPVPEWAKSRALGALFGMLVILMVLTAFGAAFAVLISTYWQAFSDSGPSLGAGTLIIGLLGAPFLIWRTLVAQRTVDIAQENHITDLINKAVEGLGAEKVVRVQLRHNDGSYMTEPVSTALDAKSKPLMTEYTAPNIEIRIGAILALERLAQKNLDVHIQIMEILTAYIRQNAPASDAVDVPELNLRDDDDRVVREAVWERWRHAYAAKTRRILANSGANGDAVRPRADVQMALTVIGRRTNAQKTVERDGVPSFEDSGLKAPEWTDDVSASEAWAKAMDQFKTAVREWLVRRRRYRLDLRETNLQGADFEHGDFENARFDGAQLQGARLVGAQMQGAGLVGAQMQGADLVETQMQGAVLLGARMQGALFRGARMQGVNLHSAQMQGAAFRLTQMQGADLVETQMQGADLSFARMQGANLWQARMQGADLMEARMQGARLGLALMQGAHIVQARMQGANFWVARLDSETNFTAADVQFAALKSINLSKSTLDQDQVNGMFGDATVVLPGGHGPDSAQWPAHWPRHDLTNKDFRSQWQKWLANPDTYTPPELPEPT
ncbi:pentapeptide repeat-containing protein [Alexandriicola marinus]|uniref:pentapeptide repeat-containing protein n=1 Tax=Alexandriicola marinus TaxID=2081710 RepID=UPI0013E077FF|nr:pentapeptide repeat-containing protein [Alexandriicola marinus]